MSSVPEDDRQTQYPGFAAIPNWIIRDIDVPVDAFAIAVFAALASHAGRGGIHPSMKTIADEARCSERRARTALRLLEEVGVVTSIARHENGQRLSNVYYLTVHGDPQVPARDAGTPAHSAPGGGTTCRGGGAPGAGEEEPLQEEPLKKKGRSRATALPDSFSITDSMRAWCRENTPLIDPDAKLGEWMDYWRGRGAVMKDWEATWRNGMRKQQEFAARDQQKAAIVNNDWMNR